MTSHTHCRPTANPSPGCLHCVWSKKHLLTDDRLSSQLSAKLPGGDHSYSFQPSHVIPSPICQHFNLVGSDVWHWATARLRCLQQKPEIPCLLILGTRLHCWVSAKNSKLNCSGCLILPIGSQTLSTHYTAVLHIQTDKRQLFIADLRDIWHCKVVLQQKHDSATLTMFIVNNNYVPTPVHSSPKRECGLLPEHNEHHMKQSQPFTLFSFNFLACGFKN